MAEAISKQITPGAVVLVSERGKVVCHAHFGMTAGLEDGGIPVETSTIYDAASLTKAVVTSTLLMGLVAQGHLSPETPVAPLLPELQGPGTEDIVVKHLAGHASGLPAHQLFYERIWSGDLAGQESARAALVHMAGHAPLIATPGAGSLYSDLGYILLARLIERVADARLDELFASQISGPLGMQDSRFVDLLGPAHPELARVAPTEKSEARGLIHGEVHDDNAHSGGGICGHAGLFTTAKDLAVLAQALCDSASGIADSLLPAKVVTQFWSTAGAPSTTWRLGWDTPSMEPGVSHAGPLWPQDSVGHLGFTGTGIWLAPSHQCFAIILTNRVYFSRDKAPIRGLRQRLMKAISTALPAIPTEAGSE